MTQPGKRRREGVIDAPDFEGLYAAQKAVKKRRRGVVRPPSLEELQVPEHHAVLAGNVGAACDGNNNNQNSPVFEGESEITNGDERVKDQEETTRPSHSSSTSSEGGQSKPSLLSPVLESEDSKDKERVEQEEDRDKPEEKSTDSP